MNPSFSFKVTFKVKSLFVAAMMIAALPVQAAGPDCAEPLRRVSSALTEVPGGLARHEFYEGAKIPQGDLSKVQAIAQELGLENIDSAYYADFIDAAFRKIKAEGGSPLDAAEKMAVFGKKLDVYIAKLPRAARKSADFAIGDAVLTLEEFKPEEFRTVATQNWVESHAPFVHTDDYTTYTRGYIDDTPPWTTHPWGGSVISLKDIREGATQNMFPLQLNPHDMRHIHYATGHPKGPAMYFKSARSHNNVRYATMSAMYEGVDTVQYGHESQIAQYMANTMHMDLEEAMVYIGRASKEDLGKILDGAGIRAAVEGPSYGAQVFADWAPPIDGAHRAAGRHGGTLDDDVNAFVDRSTGLLQRPELAKYTNFNTNRTVGTGNSRQKDVILFGNRPYELNNGTLIVPEAEPGTVGGVPLAPDGSAVHQ